jgi:hypothetical protein
VAWVASGQQVQGWYLWTLRLAALQQYDVMQPRRSGNNWHAGATQLSMVPGVSAEGEVRKHHKVQAVNGMLCVKTGQARDWLRALHMQTVGWKQELVLMRSRAIKHGGTHGPSDHCLDQEGNWPQ